MARTKFEESFDLSLNYLLKDTFETNIAGQLNVQKLYQNSFALLDQNKSQFLDGVDLVDNRRLHQMAQPLKRKKKK